MYTPPERVKHKLPDESWPAASEAAAAKLFSPVTLGPRVARQRTWVPAMVPWRATEDGFVTPDVIAWYERFARGKPGVIVVEATGIRDVPSGPLLRIGHDRFIPGMAELVAAVKRASNGETLVFLQIIDFLSIRRRPEPDKFFGRFLALRSEHRVGLTILRPGIDWLGADDGEVRRSLSSLTDAELDTVLSERELDDLRRGARERVTDTHLPHIRELPVVLPELFASAAARARDAGMDGIELHYAHAYTMASFLSARNTRDDGYGGPREMRARLPLEVLAAVRKRVGRSAVVGLRFLGDEVIDGGNHVDDAAYFGVELARAGADYLSVSKGGKFEDAKTPKIGEAVYPYTGKSGYECMPVVTSDALGPFGRNVSLAARIKRDVNAAGLFVPVVTAGGIGTFSLAESILLSGDADIVAAARGSLADPDLFLKMRAGLGAHVRRCKYTNYCEALDQRHQKVTCQLWDRLELSAPDARLDEKGRRRLEAPPFVLPVLSGTPENPSSC